MADSKTAGLTAWARFTRLMDDALGLVGAVTLFAMMTLTFVDVVMRYLFSAPLRGAFEVTELLMVVLIFAGLPVVSRHDQHVTTDLIDRFLTRAVKRAMAVAIHLVCAAALFGASWITWIKAGKEAGFGDTTAVLNLHLAPYVYLMSVLLFVAAAIHLVKAFLGEIEEGGSATL